MNAAKDWKRNLDEIFRLHEKRIEKELLEMLHTIESQTASKDDDITFMMALLDYMQLRFVPSFVIFFSVLFLVIQWHSLHNKCHTFSNFY